jgi:hypothetical protein
MAKANEQLYGRKGCCTVVRVSRQCTVVVTTSVHEPVFVKISSLSGCYSVQVLFGRYQQTDTIKIGWLCRACVWPKKSAGGVAFMARDVLIHDPLPSPHFAARWYFNVPLLLSGAYILQEMYALQNGTQQVTRRPRRKSSRTSHNSCSRAGPVCVTS